MRPCRPALLTLCLFAVSHAPAWPSFTGLTLIPTAETLARGALLIEPQVDLSTSSGSAECRIYNTQAGISERFEAGVDIDASKEAAERVFLNAKYVFLSPAGNRPAAAIGVFNVGRGLRAVPYVACCKQLSGIGLHFGGVRTESRSRWFAGVSMQVSDKVSFMADHIAGEENYSAFGVEYAFSERVALLLGEQLPNGAGDPCITIHLSVLVGQ